MIDYIKMMIENYDKMTNDEMKTLINETETLYLQHDAKYDDSLYGTHSHYEHMLNMMSNFMIEYRFNNDVRAYHKFMYGKYEY